VIAGDGCLMEGVSHEAASLAGHLRLGKLICVYDDNHITIDGRTELAFSDDTASRFRAYGWDVVELGEIADDLDALESALHAAKRTERPSLLILRPTSGTPPPTTPTTTRPTASPSTPATSPAPRPSWASPTNRSGPRRASSTPTAPTLPSVAASHRARGSSATPSWSDPPIGWRAGTAPESPAGTPICRRTTSAPSVATRKAINAAFDATVERIPGLVAGSADLTGNTGTKLAGQTTNSVDAPGGRQIAYGVREHAMGSAMVGMALHGGIIPVGGTFFVFLDYMRPPVRLAALSGAKACFVFTHDSVGVGEDGPTHQPVEQLATLRAIPGLHVIRPADANETVAAWVDAVRHDGPTALVLSRQDVEVVTDGSAVERGAGIVVEAPDPDVVLVATGSEVALCVHASTRLADAGVSVRVVSMPSWDRFEQQDEPTRHAILPPGVPGPRRRSRGLPRLAPLRRRRDLDRPFRSQRTREHRPRPARHQRRPRDRTLPAPCSPTDRGTPMNRLQTLADEFGQSPWLDNLKRSYLTSGELAAFRDRGVRGLTSNPSIFQKAIQGSDDYDEQFRQLAGDDHPVIDHYWKMVFADIHGACDVFDPVYDATDWPRRLRLGRGRPWPRPRRPGTETAARDLHDALRRRNVMVKIPATVEGLPAIEQMIAEGRNINVTLIFSLDRYQAVMDAYLAGLERFAADDPRRPVLCRERGVVLHQPGRRRGRPTTRGHRHRRCARAPGQGRDRPGQTRLPAGSSDSFSGPRWEALAARGAQVQRPLWASTGRKNPAYSDVLYVDELIGPHTVNTLPEDTLEAFADHGTLARTIDADVDDADRVWQALAEVGVDMDEVATKLEREGVDAFMKSFDELIDALEQKSAELRAD
jgi:transaldolase/transketolase C-terminal domain/subunit